MKKSMTLLATSLFALYGCGGGGGSSSSGSTGTTQFDYPINNSQFAPKNITLLSYLISEDGGENIALDIAYRDISSQQMLANIQHGGAVADDRVDSDHAVDGAFQLNVFLL